MGGEDGVTAGTAGTETKESRAKEEVCFCVSAGTLSNIQITSGQSKSKVRGQRGWRSHGVTDDSECVITAAKSSEKQMN